MKRYNPHGIKIEIGILLLAALVLFGIAWAIVTPDQVIGPDTTPAPVAVPAEIPTVQATPTPEPTPDINQTLYAAQEYQDWKYRNKFFNMTEWLTWRRDDVAGLKDMKVNTTIYGYRFESNFQEHSVSWGTGSWFTHVPRDGMKYLFVYACQYMEGSDPTWDPRMWGMGPDHFTVQVGDQLYSPLLNEVNPSEPIKELENTWDIGHRQTIAPYGYDDVSHTFRGTSKRNDASYLRMGRSNKWDGWILYEVPKDTRPEDVIILGRFDHLGGNAFWNLIPPSPGSVVSWHW